MKLPDTRSITAGKQLLEMAIEFQDISNKLNEITAGFNSVVKTMSDKEFYDGRNRENLDHANKAAAEHLVNLAQFYGMCFVYIVNAYNSMVEFDAALAKAIQQAYIGEHYGK